MPRLDIRHCAGDESNVLMLAFDNRRNKLLLSWIARWLAVSEFKNASFCIIKSDIRSLNAYERIELVECYDFVAHKLQTISNSNVIFNTAANAAFLREAALAAYPITIHALQGGCTNCCFFSKF